MKTLKTCLLILCLLPFQAVGFPRFRGANFFMKEILIKSKAFGNQYAIIDDDYEELVLKFKWFLCKGRGNTLYAAANNWHDNKNHGFQMHRLIMNFPKYKLVDHINGNGLDNRKENLRLANEQQNTHNSKPSKNNKLKIKGVIESKEKRRKKFAARIYYNGKGINLGRYFTIQEATVAYNNAAKKYFGEFAFINPIPE